MKTIAVAVLKGGSGKSMLTAALAVHAAGLGLRVAMIDMDVHQETLGTFWDMRGKPTNPILADDFGDFIDEHERLTDNGFDVLLLDTPPSVHDHLTPGGVGVADVVVIPLRPSISDLGSIGATIEMCQRFHRPFGLVMNAVDDRKAFAPMNSSIAAHLKSKGHRVFRTSISYHLAWMAAPMRGKTGAEVSRQCLDEISALWDEIWTMAEESNNG